jgi:hypothetical protein
VVLPADFFSPPDNVKVDTSIQYNEHGEMASYWRQLKVLENLSHSYLTKWLKMI